MARRSTGRSRPTTPTLAELFLLTADHADHLSGTIEPALADGDLVMIRPLLRLPVRLSGGDARRQRCRHRPPTRV